MYTYSVEHKKFLKKMRFNNFIIHLFRLLILFIFIFIWEYLSKNKIINSFLYSSPSNIIKTLSLLNKNELLMMKII